MNFFRKSTTNLANSNKKSDPLNSKPENVVLKSSTPKRNACTVDDLQLITISESVSNVNSAISNIIVHQWKNFLNEQCEDLFTDDVLNNQSFVDGIRPFLDSYLEFNNIKKDYLITKTRGGRKAELKNSLDAIANQILEIQEKLKEASAYSLDLSLGAHLVCQWSTAKLSLLLQIVTAALNCASYINFSKVIAKMKKIIGHCNTKADKIVKAIVSYNTHLKCFYSSLTWQKSLHDIENINRHKNVSIDKLLFHANLIKENVCLNTDHINEEKAIKDFILKVFLQ